MTNNFENSTKSLVNVQGFLLFLRWIAIGICGFLSSSFFCSRGVYKNSDFSTQVDVDPIHYFIIGRFGA
jgi:hypothetical protein